MTRFGLIAALLMSAAICSACEDTEAPSITSEPLQPSTGRRAREWAFQTGLTEKATEEYKFMEKVFECAKLAESLSDSLKDAGEKISQLYVIGFQAGERSFRNVYTSSDFESSAFSMPPDWRRPKIAAAYSGMALLDASYRVETYLENLSDENRELAALELYGIMSCDAMIMLSERH